MEKYGTNELREMFLSFFESKGHLRLPSFSLIPQNDASLLLINSGMAPMKPWFTGENEPPRKRVCTCQKCIRTGDIENIGKTDRHGTYFEMLGNFSFGDYFKSEAIAWCWEFLTETIGLPADRLYPSIYLDDEEAFGIWNKEIGVAPERIFRFGKADNFWEHGSGPCGPCSEVYFDRGENRGCGRPGCTVGCDCDRYIEVWNNVFTQFESDGEGNYTELAQKNIDTGLGLERLACVCQEVNSLFDTDTVMKITRKVSEITGASCGAGGKTGVSLRVITDHIRSATMMISDGVLPSNEGRGYVLRRLLRRASRHGKLLGAEGAFLHIVCDTVIEENKGAYPELDDNRDFIKRIVITEEENFAKTIDSGVKMLSELMIEYEAEGEKVFSGADAFRLYDTYGFPFEMTVEILEEKDMTVNRDEFDALMSQQRERARAARTALGDLAWAGTDFKADTPETEFSGYTVLGDTGKILAIVADGESRSSIRQGEQGIIILDRTPFYAETGGQSPDFGVISQPGADFEVSDVRKADGRFLHYGKMTKGKLKIGDEIRSSVDAERRRAIMRAHSATHLLHKALREVLGEHVNQSGSLVEPDRLRFDFTHFSAVTPDELREVETRVNRAILEGYPITVEEMSIENARAKGATALFGEKYGNVVRVVDMGGYSIELCGGTHLNNTAKAGPFVMESEFSVASGIRRAEATTGLVSLDIMSRSRQLLYAAAEHLKTTPQELAVKARQRAEEIKDLRQTLEKLRSRELLHDVERFLTDVKQIGDIKVLTVVLPGSVDMETLRKAGDFLRDRTENIVAVIASIKDGQVTFLAVCGNTAVKKGIKAGDLIKRVCAVCAGSGGGRPDSASGGGKDPDKLDEALGEVEKFVKEFQKGE
ncbi:MAG: alanine--tRNA ligase [Oscillospiraceae bacterium]|nr:alanine--tRNA ligase [Oscillospiraceae bacterium]